jgi:hypothetical protein
MRACEPSADASQRLEETQRVGTTQDTGLRSGAWFNDALQHTRTVCTRTRHTPCAPICTLSHARVPYSSP